jgi:hypothetical protein
MSERLTPERLAAIRASARSMSSWAAHALLDLLDELDAVTKERDAALSLLPTEQKSGSYSGMNFITNRDGRIR